MEVISINNRGNIHIDLLKKNDNIKNIKKVFLYRFISNMSGEVEETITEKFKNVNYDNIEKCTTALTYVSGTFSHNGYNGEMVIFLPDEIKNSRKDCPEQIYATIDAAIFLGSDAGLDTISCIIEFADDK